MLTTSLWLDRMDYPSDGSYDGNDGVCARTLLFSVPLVCKQWHTIAMSPNFWKRINLAAYRTHRMTSSSPPRPLSAVLPLDLSQHHSQLLNTMLEWQEQQSTAPRFAQLEAMCIDSYVLCPLYDTQNHSDGARHISSALELLLSPFSSTLSSLVFTSDCQGLSVSHFLQLSELTPHLEALSFAVSSCVGLYNNTFFGHAQSNSHDLCVWVQALPRTLRWLHIDMLQLCHLPALLNHLPHLELQILETMTCDEDEDGNIRHQIDVTLASPPASIRTGGQTDNNSNSNNSNTNNISINFDTESAELMETILTTGRHYQSMRVLSLLCLQLSHPTKALAGVVLEPYHNLVSLQMRANDMITAAVTGEQLRAILVNNPGLTELHVFPTPITESEADDDDCAISDWAEILPPTNKLRNVVVGPTLRCTKPGLLPHIEKLEVQCTDTIGQDKQSLCNAVSSGTLQQLVICYIPLSWLVELADMCPDLRVLSVLRGEPVQACTADGLGTGNNNTNNNAISTEVVMRSLGTQLTRLERLALRRCELVDGDVTALLEVCGHSHSLVSLDLSWNGIMQQSTLTTLAERRWPRLRFLGLSGSRINDLSPLTPATVPLLSRLELMDTAVTMPALVAMLERTVTPRDHAGRLPIKDLSWAKIDGTQSEPQLVARCLHLVILLQFQNDARVSLFTDGSKMRDLFRTQQLCWCGVAQQLQYPHLIMSQFSCW
eukprot:TRINITY_DN7881_c0_g1_i2.p1 TRINITY_DN7881_c0_g1~~TRINITY_DN7881_c0_g1_i2.p1  ORF type:complete len:717 (-),score=101.17 TRINITY_DN7881_c0_g1_i2:111-2261(-)